MAGIHMLKRRVPDWLPKDLRYRHCQRFFDTRDISDNVHGRVFLSPFEMDLIDSPEFQRLFRVSQLGFVDLLYPAANHRRGTHAIGSCGIAKVLVDNINENTRRVFDTVQALSENKWSGSENCQQISISSSILIGAAALLHDLPHAPLSHDVEKKTHKLMNEGNRDERIYSFCGPYRKHDDFAHNPALRLMLTDTRESTLARVLAAYSPIFWDLMKIESDCSSETGRELSKIVRLITGV